MEYLLHGVMVTFELSSSDDDDNYNNNNSYHLLNLMCVKYKAKCFLSHLILITSCKVKKYLSPFYTR